MSKQKLADFFYWFTTFLALVLVVESIYDGFGSWRIILRILLFGCCAIGLVFRIVERRKKDRE